MKRIHLAVILILTLMLLAACGRGAVDVEEYMEEYTVGDLAYYSEPIELNENNHMATETPNYIYLLKDLDYMQYVLENNFALFDVAYWSRGVDIHEILDNVRADIVANPDMDADEFLVSMAYNFSELASFAHFSIDLPNAHTGVISGRMPLFNAMFTERTLERWHYPHVMDFYRRQLSLGLWTQGTLRTQGDAARQIHLDRFIMFGFYDEVDEINYFVERGEYEEVSRRMQNVGVSINRRTSITMESLIYGNVAYLAIDRFRFREDPSSTEWDTEEEMIHSFFEEIRGYDHLIIDLRRNLGGMTIFFEEAIVRPIINEPIDLKGFVFAPSGYYVQERLDEASEGANLMILQEIATPIIPTDNRLRTIDELLTEFDLPELNMQDMERMDYGFPIQMERLYPIRLERFGYESAFDGKIWVLTSHLTGSAAQVNAWLSRESGFATHVGDISGGNFGGPRTAVALPHSGMMFRMDVFYVTDERGRPLEAGTVPHHFSCEGMSALETVLALIYEGDYERD